MEIIYAVVLLSDYEAPHYERFFATREAADRYVEAHASEFFDKCDRVAVWEEWLHS